MKRLGGWDTLLGLGLALGAAVLAWRGPDFTEALEYKLYDWRLRHVASREPSDDIRLVAIDEASIEATGRWPWPRSVIADLLERIDAGRPRVIGLSIVFADPEDEKGLAVLRGLERDYRGLVARQSASLDPLWKRMAKDSRYKKDLPADPLGPLAGFADRLQEEAVRLNNDAVLAGAFRKVRNVVLSYYFQGLGRPTVAESADQAARLMARALPESAVEGASGDAVEGSTPLLPLAGFGDSVAGWGHATLLPDSDGSVRRETPVMKFRKGYHPSLALEMARVALRVKPEDLRVELGREIRLGDRRIPLDAGGRMLIKYGGPFSGIKKVSAVDVLRGDAEAAARTFKDKIVLVGLTDLGLGSSFVTPVEPATQFNGVVLSAFRNIVEGDFLVRPTWAARAEWGALAFVGLFVGFLLPYLRARNAAILAALLAAGILGAGASFFWVQGWWLKIIYPLGLLLAGYMVITARRFLFTERGQERVEALNAQTNRQLGLSFQGQGLLDMAFEKLQKCPVDDEMKGVLYNLALDFERKRQFGKAGVVYDHIVKTDPAFKDSAERAKTARQAGESVSVSGLGGKAGGTIVVGQNAAKPTLGRYEIQKELGRGAMGVVYLGKDPKINRSVAIKTLRFEDDMDAETAKSVRERFFREAESAGTLNHPHIIRIYDAGEDGEISYIAMELLEGEDLKKDVEKARLLPVPQVVEEVAQIADALDYAHGHGVVHRDIKPANVMRLKDGTLRVTDFGIARITASSKTTTGTVLGTPSYMSPEQLSGKKVDGRSDLFSLGVMLYEMLTGEKPFDGDSIATLLFKIANERHPDPRLKSPERITPALKAVIDRALEKDPDARYQKGGDMARDLRAALQNLTAPVVRMGEATSRLAAPPPVPSTISVEPPAPPAPRAAAPPPSAPPPAPRPAAMEGPPPAKAPLPPPPAAPPARASEATTRLSPAPARGAPPPPEETLRLDDTLPRGPAGDGGDLP